MYYNPIENLRPEEVLAYFRKSRTDDPTLTVEEVLAKHEAILDEWAERNLGTIVPEENKYREVVSGETIADRPEVQKVLKLIESPKIKAILIVDIQRLSRGDLEDAGRLIKLIRYTNTLVITPMKTFNLSDEYDRDMFERELKRGNEFLEYQKKIMGRGRELSVSQGNFIGGAPPYGYDKVFVQEGKKKCPTLAIKEDEANVVRMVFDMYVNQDMGYAMIAHRLTDLNITPPKGKYWSGASIQEMLTNPHYIGKIRWNYRKTVVVIEDGEVKKTTPTARKGGYQIYEGKHLAIVSEELFNAVKEKKGRLPRKKYDFTLKNPFAGILQCRCGRAMGYKTFKNAATRLFCTRHSFCNTGSAYFSEIMDFTVNLLKSKIAEFEIELQNGSDNSIELHKKMIENLEKKLEKIQARELSLWESQLDPDLSKRMPLHIFQTLTDKLIKEREDVEQALKAARDSMPTPIDYEQKIITFQNALDALLDDTKSPTEKNILLKACIKKMVYHRDRPVRLAGKGNQRRYSNPPIEITVEFMV